MRVAATFCFLFFAASAAQAQTAQSAYTRTGGTDCRITPVRQDGIEIGSTTVCKGFAGIAVTQFEDDDRVAVSYGRRPSAEPAASTFFGPLNSIGDMIEWRYVKTAGKSAPYATILRWRLRPVDENDNVKTLDVLVVSRLALGPVCHVAYVDTEANQNANELARQAADQAARGFRCGTDKPVMMGHPGRGGKILLQP